MTFYDSEMGEAFWIAIAIMGLVGIVPAIFFLANLRGLLEQVRPQNRAMQPNSVWLNLIPLFNYVWLIVTVVKIRDSVDSEIRSRGWAVKGDSGFGVGLAFAILWLVAGVLFLIPFLVCWIIYWMKTAELKKQLARSQPPAGWAPLPAPPVGGGGVSPDRYDVPGAGAPAGDVSQAPTPEEAADVEVADREDCPLCGSPNRPDARFCSSCGRPIA